MSLDHTLAHSNVIAPGATPSKRALFLHGILGSGSNLRSLARKVVQQHPAWEAVLVDLRKHGDSQSFAAPHDLKAAASDIETLGTPVHAIVGHSFGGKVALARVAQSSKGVEHVVLLDSNPGARPDRRGSESTTRVLAMLDALPTTYEKREDFVAQVRAAGQDAGIAQWLAMNLARDGERFVLRIDLPAIRALLDDYFARDLWSVVEEASARFTFVIGGRSTVLDEAERARIVQLGDDTRGRVRSVVLPDAGHWVHVDALDATAAAIDP